MRNATPPGGSSSKLAGKVKVKGKTQSGSVAVLKKGPLYLSTRWKLSARVPIVGEVRGKMKNNSPASLRRGERNMTTTTGTSGATGGGVVVPER